MNLTWDMTQSLSLSNGEYSYSTTVYNEIDPMNRNENLHNDILINHVLLKQKRLTEKKAIFAFLKKICSDTDACRFSDYIGIMRNYNMQTSTIKDIRRIIDCDEMHDDDIIIMKAGTYIPMIQLMQKIQKDGYYCEIRYTTGVLHVLNNCFCGIVMHVR